jgi:hypothetical protein
MINCKKHCRNLDREKDINSKLNCSYKARKSNGTHHAREN